MAEQLLTISQIYTKGKENIKSKGTEWSYPGGGFGPSVLANRKYLDSLFFETKFFDPVDVDTSFSIFGLRLKTPVFCSAISRTTYMDEMSLSEIARGIAKSGSLIMLGIGGSEELQGAIDTGAPVVKMIKPYRNTDLIYNKLHEAEKRGCVAVGMDIDHFYGLQRVTGEVQRTETFAPQRTEELRQLISQSKLPFIIKGVLSLADAEKAFQLGASSIVVSNHGSGSLAFSVPSVIALALGARGIGFGSSMILAWAAGGSTMVEMLVNQLTAELSRTMAATGCPNLTAINRSNIVSLSSLV